MRKEILDNKKEKTFEESDAKFCMNLSERERAMLILVKSFFGVEVHLTALQSEMSAKLNQSAIE